VRSAKLTVRFAAGSEVAHLSGDLPWQLVSFASAKTRVEPRSLSWLPRLGGTRWESLGLRRRSRRVEPYVTDYSSSFPTEIANTELGASSSTPARFALVVVTLGEGWK
jgi:hypothetical protein